MVFEPHKPTQYLRHELSTGVVDTQSQYLRLSNDMLHEDEQTICFNISLGERGHFQGEIQKLAAPLSIDDGILFQDPGSGHTSFWVVQIPHATFRGILVLDGTVRRLAGMAYQDHQWGNLLLQEFVSDWVWGHFSNAETAVVFFQILTQHGQLIERAAWLTKEGRFVGASINSKHLDTLFQDSNPEQYAEQATVSFMQNCGQLSFDLSPTCLMRSRLNEQHDGKVASYLRWSTKASLQLGRHNNPSCGAPMLHGISEYIRIRPAVYGKLSNQ